MTSDLWLLSSGHSLFATRRAASVDALEFSDRLRTVLSEARQEAARLQHAHVGTEHMLIALLDDSTRDGRTMPSLAGVVLDVLGVDRARMHEVLERTVLRGQVPTPE